jgi:voltage-gated potassium channel
MRTRVDVERRFELWYERLTLPRAVATVIAVAFVLVMVAGGLARLVEPDVFTSIGLAYWWAVVTVTTVGYGDVVPESPAGRLVGTALMLTGLGLIPTLTSVTVAILIGKRTSAQQAQLDRQGKEHAAALERIEARLDRLGEDRPS